MKLHVPAVAARWIADTLKGDTVLAAMGYGRVYRTVAPKAAAVPYVLFALQSGGTDSHSAGDHSLGTPIFQIKIVSDSTTEMEAHDTALHRIAALFNHGGNVISVPIRTVDGPQNISVRLRAVSEGSFEISEPAPGNTFYNNQGMLWRVFVSAES